VATDVEEATQLAVARTRDDDGNLAGGRGEIGPVLGDLSRMADVLPRARKDSLSLTAENVGVGIPGPGQRLLHGREL
jgi:hypothetical protein